MSLICVLNDVGVLSNFNTSELNKLMDKETPFNNMDINVALFYALLNHVLNKLEKLMVNYVPFLKLNHGFYSQCEDYLNKLENINFLLKNYLRNLNKYTQMSNYLLNHNCVNTGFHSNTMKAVYFRWKGEYLRRPGEKQITLSSTLNSNSKSNTYLKSNKSTINDNNYRNILSKISHLNTKISNFSNNNSLNYNTYPYNSNLQKIRRKNNNNDKMPSENKISSYMDSKHVPRPQAIDKLKELSNRECWQFQKTGICKNGLSCWYKH